MIYIHDKSGKLANKYSELSGINFILQYRCHGKYNGFQIDKNARNIQVACPNENYVDDWIKLHEFTGEYGTNLGINRGFTFHTPVSCVSIWNEDFSWWIRRIIEIDWNKDYYFYFNEDMKEL